MTATYLDHLTLLVIEGTTVSEAAISEASETSSVFVQRMNRSCHLFHQSTGDVHFKSSGASGEGEEDRGDEDKASAISTRIDDAPATSSLSRMEEALPTRRHTNPHHAIFQLWQLENVRSCHYSSCNIIKQEEKGSCPVSKRCTCQSHQESSLSCSWT
jgi:hypothetical protein